jgi:hypothetical protein
MHRGAWEPPPPTPYGEPAGHQEPGPYGTYPQPSEYPHHVEPQRPPENAPDRHRAGELPAGSGLAPLKYSDLSQSALPPKHPARGPGRAAVYTPPPGQIGARPRHRPLSELPRTEHHPRMRRELPSLPKMGAAGAVVVLLALGGGYLVRPKMPAALPVALTTAEEAKTAEQVYRDVTNATLQATSVHLTATQDSPTPSRTVATVTQSAAKVEMTRGDTPVQLVYVKGHSWASGGTYGATWMALSDTSDETKQMGVMTLGGMSGCLGQNHGTLTKGDVAMVNGQRSLVLHDDGQAPGAVKADYYVGLGDKPYLVRSVETTPNAPGRGDVCGGDVTSASVTTTNFDHYDSPTVEIAPPGMMPPTPAAPGLAIVPVAPAAAPANGGAAVSMAMITNQGQQYLAAVNSTNAAMGNLVAKAAAAKTTGPALAAGDFQALLDTMNMEVPALTKLMQQSSANTAADIDALIKNRGMCTADLTTGFGATDAAAVNTSLQTFVAHWQAGMPLAAKVRADVGLPPAPQMP